MTNEATAHDQPGKESKDEVLYRGKPASFWIRQLKDRDVSFRLDAVKALREIGTEEEGVVSALVKTLADKDQSVQDAAREAIGSFPLEGRIPALVQILRGKDMSVRPAAIELLGGIGSKAKDAIPDLTQALADKDANIRSKAANAVGKIGVPDSSAITALVKLLNDEDISVRLEATKSLGEIGQGTKEAIPSLLERMSPKTEKDASIRLEAVKTLWVIGNQTDEVLSAILVACSDADERVSKQALKAVSDVDVKQRVPILAQSLKTDDNKTRLIALQFLEEISADAKNAVPAVAEVLKIEDESLRFQAAKMLGKVGKDAGPATPALIGLLADKSAQVRVEAANALKTIPIVGKLPALVIALKDKNIPIRAYAVGELREAGPDDLLEIGADAKDAIPSLLERMSPKTEKDASIRLEAVKTLWAIGKQNDKVLSAILVACSDADERVSEQARKTISDVDVRQRVPILIQSLKTDDDKTRLIALQFLAEVGADAKDAIPTLIPLLQEKAVRVSAAKALGKIGPDANAAIPTLKKMLDEDDEVLQSTALAALRSVRTPTNGIGMKFVWIPPGTFLMGSTKAKRDRRDDEFQHKVTLTRGFYMSVHLVTQEQWQAVMGNNPSHFKGEKNLPVENVSWEACQEFVKKLQEKDKKPYRLPTESEWEYSCRAGTTTPFYLGEMISTDKANYKDIEVCYDADDFDRGRKGLFRQKTTPVGSFPANAFGLFDMHGNLWEWCQDWFGDYPQNDVVDPQGPEKPNERRQQYRVLRGGSWYDGQERCRSASRATLERGHSINHCGLRVCFFDE